MSQTLKLQTRRLGQAGFTLFEILIVVGILGGLMAFVIKKVNDNRIQANVRQTRIAMAGLVQNLTMYQSDCQKYPTSLDGLVKSDGCANWTGPYTKDVPKDSFGTAFIYESDGATYSLKSLGADRKEGGDGFNKDINVDELQ